MKKVSIIIPTYNEKDNIAPLVRAMFDLGLKNLRVIIIDDNSPDGTGEIADELIKKYSKLKVIHRQKKQGLGRAYIDVFNRVIQGEIESDFIVTIDADFSHPVGKIPEIIDKLNQGYDLVVGSRYVKDGSTKGWDFRRRFLSQYANLYAKVITGIAINDLTAGFCGYNVELLKNIDLNQVKFNGYAFQIEMKYKMLKTGARFTETPITFIDRKKGRSKFNKNIFWEAIFAPWKLRFKK